VRGRGRSRFARRGLGGHAGAATAKTWDRGARGAICDGLAAQLVRARCDGRANGLPFAILNPGPLRTPITSPGGYVANCRKRQSSADSQGRRGRGAQRSNENRGRPSCCTFTPSSCADYHRGERSCGYPSGDRTATVYTRAHSSHVLNQDGRKACSKVWGRRPVDLYCAVSLIRIG
jgi:hypothetical protein